MYFSQLFLNPRSRQVQREIAERYEMHRTLMQAFKEANPKEERILFRLEMGDRGNGPRVLVQSHTRPQWLALKVDYLANMVEGNPQVKVFDINLRAGQRLIFRLLANPTARRKFPNEENGKRVGLSSEEAQRDWLDHKSQGAGFRIQDVRLTQRGTLKARLFRDGKRHDLTMLATQFDGLLEVTDAKALVTVVGQGIGSGKGLGFGLLSLARYGS